MNRRSFMKRIGLLAAIAVSPKAVIELARAYAANPEPRYDWNFVGATIKIPLHYGSNYSYSQVFNEKIAEAIETMKDDLHRNLFQTTPLWRRLKR